MTFWQLYNGLLVNVRKQEYCNFTNESEKRHGKLLKRFDIQIGGTPQDYLIKVVSNLISNKKYDNKICAINKKSMNLQLLEIQDTIDIKCIFYDPKNSFRNVSLYKAFPNIFFKNEFYWNETGPLLVIIHIYDLIQMITLCYLGQLL